MPKFVRYDQPTVLRNNTKVLGATAAEWDAALTGNMAITLQRVKLLAESGVKRDVANATVFDVASSVSASLHQR
ncbi:hypothetical protein ACLB1G_15570 [Oxalobacteraceae bacterium A2-2]